VQEASSSTSELRDSGKGPALSPEGVQALKTVQEDVIRMLAEGKIETGRYNQGILDGLAEKHVKENAQNVRNRQCMTTYSAQIQRSVLLLF
jgi:kinetochore protein Mis13/DSN1